MERKEFQAESKRLLELMIHSIYTHKEIFLREILSNASDAIDKLCYRSLTDEQVGMKREDFAITIRPDQEARTLTVSDNGIGIPDEDLPHIFDRFYRTDASRNSATGGSGIGLSIVKKIIEDHGGKIWATSKEDSGTTMYFVIRKYQEVTANEQNTDR